MRRGQRKSPWRAVRHSLFVCGLSLVIALAGSVATFLVPEEEAPSFLKAAASTPSHQALATQEAPKTGSSSSFGLLTRVVKEAATGNSSDDTPPLVAGLAESSDAEASAGESPASMAIEQPDAGADGQTSDEPTPEARATSDASPPSTPTPAPLVLNEVAAEAADIIVSASRFETPLSSSFSTVSAAQTQMEPEPEPEPEAASEALQAGDRITVPITFYYCEETTGGQRAGDGGGFCGAMRNGDIVHPGAAACDVAFLGQRFIIEGDPTGRTYVCADTGGGIHYQHRDIWFLTNSEGWAWQAVVGRSAVIQILP